ncbi:MAG: hypothetical protein OEV44_10010 [Spirochaetota bacterium]|nr:hypothetical protein [Spirochaetota bacterium]
MGTSSMYTGPGGGNPLLPEGYSPENDVMPERDDKPTKEPEDKKKKDNPENDERKIARQEWSKAKANFTRFANNAKGATAKRSVSSYVRAHGGAKRAGSTARSGKKTTTNLGNFLGSLNSIGWSQTFRDYNIDYIGKDVAEVLSLVVNKIGPEGNTKEDAYARSALINTMEVLYSKVENNETDMDKFSALDSIAYDEVMQCYIGEYIYERFIGEMASRLEMHIGNPGTAKEKEDIIKEYIKGTVELKNSDHKLNKVTYNAKNVKKIIDEIYTSCYSVLEDQI